MTAATDAAAGVWEDDSSLSAFAPTLPPPPRDGSTHRRPAAAAPVRPASRLADLFAEEDREDERDSQCSEPQPATEPEPVRVRFPGLDEEGDRVDETADAPLPAVPVWLGVARGVAGVLAAGCLADAFTEMDAPAVPEFAPLPDRFAAPLTAFCGTGLGVFAVRGCLPAVPRLAATLAAAALATFAAKNAALDAGLAPHVLWQTAACAAVVAAAVRLAPHAASPAGWTGRLAAFAGAAACGVGFPLAGGALDELTPADRKPAAVAVAVGGWWAEVGGGRPR